MARYTHLLTLTDPLSHLYEQVKDMLESFNFQVDFVTDDYLMARENPGRVPFAKLVTVEVLFDPTKATAETTTLNFVVKNEELPLQTNNHCFLMYQQLTQAITENKNWTLIDSVAGAEN